MKLNRSKQEHEKCVATFDAAMYTNILCIESYSLHFSSFLLICPPGGAAMFGVAAERERIPAVFVRAQDLCRIHGSP